MLWYQKKIPLLGLEPSTTELVDQVIKHSANQATIFQKVIFLITDIEVRHFLVSEITLIKMIHHWHKTQNLVRKYKIHLFYHTPKAYER